MNALILFLAGGLLCPAPGGAVTDRKTDTLTLPLWPAGTPGITPGRAGEHDASAPGDRLVGGLSVIRLAGVTDPTITLFRPERHLEKGTAVVVFPGGGYNILALDLEGTEVCRWLNGLGVTAILLKYRVPDPAPHLRALEDAQRAIGLVRSHAGDWNIDPQKVGVLGFSAGGHLAASLSCAYQKRVYAPVDDADRLSCRPDFSVLIYPAYLAAGEGQTTLDSSIHVTKATPPAFLIQTQKDPIGVNNSIAYYGALTQAGVQAEMHLFEEGDHGYGLRPCPQPVCGWPSRLEEWMRSRGLLPPAH